MWSDKVWQFVNVESACGFSVFGLRLKNWIGAESGYLECNAEVLVNLYPLSLLPQTHAAIAPILPTKSFM